MHRPTTPIRRRIARVLVRSAPVVLALLVQAAFLPHATAQQNLSVTVTPALPSASAQVRIDVSYELPDTCYNLESTHSISGNDIHVDIDQQRTGGPCFFGFTTYSVQESPGTLPTGQYDLTVRINGQVADQRSFQVVQTSAFGLLSPDDDGNLCTLGVFDWQDAPVVAPTYEVLVAADPSFQTIVASRSGLASSRTVVDTFPDTEDQFLWWTVKVTDAQMNTFYSEEVRQLTVNPVGGCLLSFGTGADAIIVGLVQSGASLALLSGATVAVAQQGLVAPTVDVTDTTGAFILDIGLFEAGQSIQVTISKSGFADRAVQVPLQTRTLIDASAVALDEIEAKEFGTGVDPGQVGALMRLIDYVLEED